MAGEEICHILSAMGAYQMGGGVALGVVAMFLYLLPTIIAHSRRVVNRGTVTVLNIFLGWTVVGWIIFLAMAFGATEKPQSQQG